jgi:hypothetical protein
LRCDEVTIVLSFTLFKRSGESLELESPCGKAECRRECLEKLTRDVVS